MKIQWKRSAPEKISARVIVLPCFEGEKPLGKAAKSIDATLDGALSSFVEEGEFHGKRDEMSVHRSRVDGESRRFVLLGLGVEKDFGAEGMRRALSSLAQAFGSKAETMAVCMDDLPIAGRNGAVLAQSAAEGFMLTNYVFGRFKKSDGPRLERVWLSADDADLEKTMKSAVEDGIHLAEATATARDLCNLPGNHGTPEVLASNARRIGKARKIKVTVHGPADLEKMRMGSLLSVSLGSPVEPRLIVMEWGRRRKGRPTVCVVGKGLTFDSGGISIKPADGMDKMKHDKGGGSAVIGILEAVSRLALPVHVVGIVPASENMPGGNANKPGDVVTASNGKTIEILNTDAEGRLILADALVHAQTFKPDYIIDLATLTGACMVALGAHCAGLMCNDDDLAKALIDAGNQTFERVWRLPLWDEYADEMKGQTTDLKNLGGRYGGALTAAGFLRSFVGEHKWAHLDIAGVAWDDPSRPYNKGKGATGYGVRLVTQFIRSLA